jgi:hypothetical protein
VVRDVLDAALGTGIEPAEAGEKFRTKKARRSGLGVTRWGRCGPVRTAILG